MKNNYRIVCGRYDAFAIDYDMQKEINNAECVTVHGFKNAKSIVEHGIKYNKYINKWSVCCPNCGKFWIVEKIKK